MNETKPRQGLKHNNTSSDRIGQDGVPLTHVCQVFNDLENRFLSSISSSVSYQIFEEFTAKSSCSNDQNLTFLQQELKRLHKIKQSVNKTVI